MRSLLVLLGGLALAGCAPAVELDVEVEGEAVVQGGGLVEQLLDAFPAFEGFTSFDIESSSELENNQTTKDHIREARLTLIRLSILGPEGATFDFLNEINFFVESPKHPKVQVATKSLPNGATTVDLELADVELGPYVRDDTLSVTTTANGRRPSEDVTVRAEMTLHVVAQP